MAQYLGKLADYDFKLVHKPGTTNKANHLSRCLDYDTGTNDNKDVVVIPPHLFINAVNMLSLKQKVYGVQEECKEEIEELWKTHPLDQVNRYWFHKGQPVVPNRQGLQREILQQYHDHEMAGHPGIINTVIAVSHEYWWPEMKKFIAAYVWGCTTCQSTKPNTVCPKPPIMLITSEQALTPFHTIAMDLITDLPMSKGYDSILTIVDHGCSKATIFLPCWKTIDAKGVATLYTERIFSFYGIPKQVISDRDPHFMA